MRAPLWAYGALLACWPLFACDGDPAVVTDGGVDAAVDAELGVTPPNIPWLADAVPPIMLSPCPEGWREVPGDSVVECDPYPSAVPEECDAGEAHFVGEAGCRPIGDACPTGDYATTLPSDGVVMYVNPLATGGGPTMAQRRCAPASR